MDSYHQRGHPPGGRPMGPTRPRRVSQVMSQHAPPAAQYERTRLLRVARKLLHKMATGYYAQPHFVLLEQYEYIHGELQQLDPTAASWLPAPALISGSPPAGLSRPHSASSAFLRAGGYSSGPQVLSSLIVAAAI